MQGEGRPFLEREKLALSDEDKLCHVVGVSERVEQAGGWAGGGREGGREGNHVSGTEGDSLRIVSSSEGDGDISRRGMKRLARKTKSEIGVTKMSE